MLKTSARESGLIETDDRKKFVDKQILSKINAESFSRYTCKGPVFAERLRRTIRNILEKPVFQKCDVKWFDQFPSITKTSINTVSLNFELTPAIASTKKMSMRFLKI